MKRILLLAALFAGALGMHAQSKATAVVTLTTGMTAKIELNNTTSTATLTFTGPSDRWFALQIGSFTNSGGMQDGTDVVYSNGTTLVDAVQQGLGAAPTADTNDWTVSSNTVSGTTRTIIATRAFNTGSNDDFTFVYSDINIDFAWAKASTATNSLITHGANRGYSLNNAYACMAPSAPTASAQTFCAGATVANLTATGEAGATFKWYAAATGGTALAATTVLTNGTTYYVSQTVGECESTRTASAVTITTVATPGGSASQQYEAGDTVSDLQITVLIGASIQWYIMDGGNLQEIGLDHVLQDGVTYYVTQTIDDCESEPLAITANEVLGTPTFSLKNLAVYPNPVVDVLTVSYNDTITDVKVINMLGQVVIVQNVNAEKAEINTSALQNGSYILKVATVKGEAAVKIVK